MAATKRVYAPGRVNLIGDHTDYTGGLVFPMAIDRGITIDYADGGSSIELTSDAQDDRVSIDLPFHAPPADVPVAWGTYVAAVAQELGARRGLSGAITSTIPAGAGLSSSAALECAVGLALDFAGTPVELALMAQRAEHAATGVPTGIMDQLCIAAAIEGHATLIDCHTLDVTNVPVPDDLDVVVLFVAHRTLVGSAYADRVGECARAEAALGPLRLATLDDVDRGDLDDVARRRSRHVISENQRVRDFAAALERADYATAGAIMTASHRSLAADFETSTAAMDAAVADLTARSGVFGARMTGGGFGGCVVALCEPGALANGWLVRASAGAHRCDPA
jgi:galactokinase